VDSNRHRVLLKRNASDLLNKLNLAQSVYQGEHQRAGKLPVLHGQKMPAKGLSQESTVKTRP